MVTVSGGTSAAIGPTSAQRDTNYYWRATVSHITKPGYGMPIRPHDLCKSDIEDTVPEDMEAFVAFFMWG